MKKLLISVLTFVLLAGCNEATKTEKTSTEEKQQCKRNKAVENIMNRRSIRAYKPEQIKQEQLDTIMQCAINAPSAMNKQPWEVRVVQNVAILDNINKAFIAYTKKEAQEGYSVFYNSPTLIIVARDKENAYSASDCGMLAQNILLSAESMGIGTCVIGGVAASFKGDDAKNLLEAIKIPDTHEVIYGIAIGYKNESPDAKPRDTAKVKYIK